MACGYNYSGQLGNGMPDNSLHSTPAQIISLNGITAIAAGDSHSLFLKNDSTVWACGINNLGQLGDGTNTDKYTPVQVSSLNRIVSISTSYKHSLFLKNDSSVWACGDNQYGELGIGTSNNSYPSPLQVSSINNIIAISAGWYHSLFLKNDSTVWACGSNQFGQLGDGTIVPHYTPVQISSLSGIIAIAAGDRHSLFLKSDGTIWACGYNQYGQLGNGIADLNPHSTPINITSLTDIIAIAAGYNYSLFLKNGSAVWASGHNYYGELGDGTTTDRWTPVLASSLTGVKAIAAGLLHSLFLKNDNTVWACGLNNHGQLGDGTTYDRLLPAQVTGLCNIITAVAEESSGENNISVYPNPFSTQTVLQTNNLLHNATLTVNNCFGQTVKEIRNISGQTITLQRDNLPSGLYFTRVTQDNKVISKDKFVIAD